MAYQRAVDVPFERVAELLERLMWTKKPKKLNVLRKWRRDYLPENTEDVFLLYRLLIPQASARGRA